MTERRSEPSGRWRAAPARWSALAVLCASLCASGCRHARSQGFSWVSDLPEAPQGDAEYRIAPGDVIAVRVWQQDSMSNDRVRVRDDGKVSVPFLQDVDVAGSTPPELSSRLQAKLKAFVVNPVVTVTLLEQRPVRVSVVGEVAHPGVFELERASGVLHALAAAGGLTQYAHRDAIYVLRRGDGQDGSAPPARIRFRWGALSSGDARPAGFRMRSGDVVLVE